MTPEQLYGQMRQKKTMLCVGLDTDPARIPAHLQDEADPVFAFNQAIIEATAPYAVAYKPNIAFYEAMGPSGWESLRKTLAIIPKDCLVVADAKRGDIGNTAERYAQAFFGDLDAGAITIAPYMGRDAVEPFLQWENRWTFVLGLTSNPGAKDFQYIGTPPLYQQVITQAQSWAVDKPGHLGFVVGATRAESMAEIRALAPTSFFLVPGVGAQGGDLHAVCAHGRNDQGGLLINSSRGIIYADNGLHFAEAAAEAAQKLQVVMADYV